MNRTHRGRTLLGGLGLAVALTVSGCVSVPGSGPVESGLADLQQGERLVQIGAAGPSAGDTQEQLVRGFLIAANSSLGDYAVAREFLTSRYANEWNPYDGVLVSEGSRPYREEGEDAGMLSLALVAKVDATGTMLPVESGASTELRFEFERQGNEWRISSAPTGVIVEKPNFLAIWSSHQLYFLGPEARLVPETRWFLSRTALATEVVGALIAGPSSRLETVVRSGFPPGVRLTKSTVQVVDGLARVDLTGEALSSEATQQEILIQLHASLQTVPGVNRVELLVEGTPVKPAVDPSTLTSIGSGPMRAAGVKDDEFGIITGGSIEPVTGISPAVEQLDPKSVSLGRAKTVAAALTDEGTYLVTDGSIQLIDTRHGQLPPSVDDDEWVWTSTAEEPHALRVSAADGTQADLEAKWLEGLKVRSIRVSPGGSLLAALATVGDKSVVRVGGIVRDNEGTPIGITDIAEDEMWAGGQAIDFDWVDQLRFVALTKQGGAGKLTVGGPGAFPHEQGSVANAERVAGGGSRAQIRVMASDGELFAPQGGSGWQLVNSGIEMLARRG